MWRHTARTWIQIPLAMMPAFHTQYKDVDATLVFHWMDPEANFELLDNLGLLDLRNHEQHPRHKRCQTVAKMGQHTCDPGHCLLPRQISHMLQETQGTKTTSAGGIRLPTSIRKSWSKASRVLDFVLHPGRPWHHKRQLLDTNITW